MDVKRFARLPARIKFSPELFKRGEEHIVVRMVITNKMIRNCCMDVTTIKYWSPVLIKAVFEATFSFPNVL